jgi:hypothetical protein
MQIWLKLDLFVFFLSAGDAEPFAVDRGEEPSFHFCGIPQGVALPRPLQKSLLHKILCRRIAPAHAQSEAVESLVVGVHDLLEARRGVVHAACYRAVRRQFNAEIEGEFHEGMRAISTWEWRLARLFPRSRKNAQERH